jgi:thioredoxin 1
VIALADLTEDKELQRIRESKARDIIKAKSVPFPGNGKPVHVDTIQQFNEIIDKYQDTPVVIDFWADWCGPCKMLAPVYEQVASRFKRRVIFLKVNSDNLAPLASYFRVSSIPDVILVHRKAVKAVWIGLRPQEFYVSALEKFIREIKN